jgi:cytoskeletal protein RodZ
VRVGVLGVVVVLVGTYLLTRGGGDDVTTATPKTSRTATASASASASSPPGESPAAATDSPTPSETASPSESASPSSTERPPTLAFRVLRPSYITVRVPGGRTLVSKVFRKGQSRTFDQKTLQVVNGRPSAVRFTVNGKPRKPGPPEQPETFTVRRS